MTSTTFFFKLLEFSRPYRGRMILGIIVGFLAGLTNPLLMGSIKLVVDTVFTDAKSSGLLTKQRPVPGFFQPVLDWVQTWATGFDARSSTTMTVLIPMRFQY